MKRDNKIFILDDFFDTDDSINIQINKYYTDVDGAIIDKSTLPANLKNRVPVFIWNGFDLDSGYSNSVSQNPPVNPMVFIKSLIIGKNFDFTQFSGLNELSTSLNIGDVVLLYSDSELNPSYFIWIQLTTFPKPLSGIIKNSNGLELSSIKIYFDNVNSYNQVIGVLQTSQLGETKFDTVSPFVNLSPNKANTTFSRIPIKGTLSPFLGFTTYIPFNEDTMSFELIFNK